MTLARELENWFVLMSACTMTVCFNVTVCLLDRDVSTVLYKSLQKIFTVLLKRFLIDCLASLFLEDIFYCPITSSTWEPESPVYTCQCAIVLFVYIYIERKR